jgi:hypothetical protein
MSGHVNDEYLFFDGSNCPCWPRSFLSTRMYSILQRNTTGSVSGTKLTMSPKFYEAISEKFHGVWGNYTDWAYSVSFSFRSLANNALTLCLQELFITDTKACSDYGLVTPFPSLQEARSVHSPSRGRFFLGTTSFSTQVQCEAGLDSGRRPKFRVCDR